MLTANQTIDVGYLPMENNIGSLDRVRMVARSHARARIVFSVLLGIALTVLERILLGTAMNR